MAEATADLECRGINKDFGTFRAVNDVSFAVPPGTFFSILGPSGCGKTTLLRMAAGFLEPTSGDLLIKGRSMLNVPPNKRPVSMVFQHLALFPMMDVAANIGFGLRRRGEPREDIARKVDAVLARVGLPDVGGRRILIVGDILHSRVARSNILLLNTMGARVRVVAPSTLLPPGIERMDQVAGMPCPGA